MLIFFKKIWTPVFIAALHFFLCCFTGIASPVFADPAHPKGISTDGSLGQKIHLQGPDYEIKAEYGKQAGRNLFHSFQQFNIHSNESTVFAGPDSVQNIISRITGNETSWIDGKLRSEIAGADLYLLNPAGIMFGPNAFLDLTGSFHVSTADYLKMDENDQFFSQPIENELLSSAPPSAFGFLGNNASLISFEGRGQISEDEWDGNPAGLSVPEGKTISVAGGDIEIKNGAWFEATEYNELGYVNPHGEKLLGSLNAPGGRINMTGIASAGEVSIENGKSETGDVAGGNIAVSNKSLIDVSGGGAGSVFIQSGQFLFDDSAVYGKNFGNKDGGRIDIQADNISVENGSEINASNYGQGNGVDVSLKASETIRFSGHDEFKNVSRISLENYSKLENAGNTGNLDIMADDLVFSDGAYLTNTTFGSGNAGNIRLQAENDIRLGGMGYDPYVNYYGRLYNGENPINPEASFGGVFSFAHLFSTGGNGGNIEMKGNNIFLTDGVIIGAMTLGTGNAGSVRMIADQSILMDGSIGPGEWSGGISVLTFGGDAGDIFIKGADLTIKGGFGISANSSMLCTEGQCGKTGDVNIRLSGDILVSGVNPYGGWESNIGTDTGSGNPGGNIFIEAGSATIENGASITSVAYADGDGGNIEIHADDSVIVKGSSPLKTYNYDFSQDGISIDYGKYTIEDKPSAILSNSYPADLDSGDSGTVYVQAKNIHLSDRGTIATSSSGGGNAGVVTLESGRLELKNKASVISESTFPENGGEAGAININADSVKISGNSALNTEAKGANGGRIHVKAGDWLYLNNSKITSSVKQGAGRGGDITASSDSIILNHAGIAANAEQGDGGAIFIQTNHFFKSWDSTTQAASRRGNQGTVKIEAPDVDITGGIADLSDYFIEPTQWLSTPCDQRTAQDASRFVIAHPDGVPLSFDDLRSVVNERLFISRQRSSITDKGSSVTDKVDFAGLIHLLENEETSLGNAVRLANSYMAMGHYRKAGDMLNAACPLAQLSEDAGEKALFFTVSGDLRLILKDMEGAVVDTKKGLALARRADSPLIAASALNGLGNIRNAGANWRRAVEAYTESLDAIDGSGADPGLTSDMKARVLINITRTQAALGEYPKALSAAEKAAMEIHNQPDAHAKAANLLALYLAAWNIPDFPENQEQWLIEAAQIGESIGHHRIASLAWGYLGRYYEQRM